VCGGQRCVCVGAEVCVGGVGWVGGGVGMEGWGWRGGEWGGPDAVVITSPDDNPLPKPIATPTAVKLERDVASGMHAIPNSMTKC
jgi:hypothetical protein